MKLIVFRHAERQRTFEDDPKLNIRGEAQAQAILKAVETQQLPTPTRILCSPKKRALMTLRPTADRLGLSMDHSPFLDERQNHESSAQFRERISDFFDDISQSNSDTENLFICSHLDWLEDMMNIIPLDLTHSLFHWGLAAYMIFEIGDEWRVLGQGQIL